jgi:shikimate kinase
MATGKSAIARMLSRLLDWPLIDCDAEIATRAGKSIAQIFRDHGEAHFRACERELVMRIAAGDCRCAQCGNARPAVVALGGGTMVDPVNYEALCRAGVIICLTARPEIIARRVGSSARSRPMLMHGEKPLPERIQQLMEARTDVYAGAAVTVDTSDLNIEQAATAVLAAYIDACREQWARSA